MPTSKGFYISVNWKVYQSNFLYYYYYYYYYYY